MRFLVTGAHGFVGRPLCMALFEQGHQVRAAVRSADPGMDEFEQAVVGAIDGETDWSAALRGVDVVMHLAARVHQMKDNADNPLAEFRKVNLYGTENLAKQAAHAGVRRFVHVSSIKVNGEETTGRYTEQDVPAPRDPYAISKWESEQALQHISQETGLEVVMLRPPLVYGPGVKGNFIRLLEAIDRGMPLPLAGADNQRSLIYVGNLVDALIACATHPAAAGQTYLVSDNEAVSTAELVDKIASALGRRSRSFYFPPALLRKTAALFGYSAQVDRLFGSLRVDGGKLRHDLGWAPPYTLEQGLLATVEWYRNSRQRG